MSLFDKSALVLGGIGGIGKAIIDNLLKSGVKRIGIIDIVALEDVKELLDELLYRNSGVHFVYARGRVEDEEELRSAMTEISTKLNGLDFIINSVGILKENDPKNMILINFYGTVNSTLIGIELMRKDTGGNGGRIINISSAFGTEPVFPLPVYAATKNAVIGYTRALAESEGFFERTGIHFITILPGVTATKLIGLKNVVENFIFPEMRAEVLAKIGSSSYHLSYQEPDWVGKCIVTAIEEGQTGDVWLVEKRIIKKIEIAETERFK